jgi:feruloyl esterase
MKEPSRVGVFKYWLFNDPNWDVRTLDYDRDFAYATSGCRSCTRSIATSTPFKKSGGKLISYAGWMDPSCRRRTPRRITRASPR